MFDIESKLTILSNGEPNFITTNSSITNLLTDDSSTDTPPQSVSVSLTPPRHENAVIPDSVIFEKSISDVEKLVSPSP